MRRRGYLHPCVFNLVPSLTLQVCITSPPPPGVMLWVTLLLPLSLPPLLPLSLPPLLQVCYAKELKEGFVEYTEQVVKLMVPLLKFYFHDDILSPLTSDLPSDPEDPTSDPFDPP